ncbi:MAG: hypothetical protein JKX73_03895 [Flavobacteriales bacterium]|nr:hypothetical protein [Flavobacteriales bacterium]
MRLFFTVLLLINVLRPHQVTYADPLPLKHFNVRSYYISDSTLVDSLPDLTSVASDNALESKVTYNAVDSIRFDMGKQKAFLYGDADVYFETTTLSADYIELNMGENLVYACGVPDSLGELQGKPVFKDEGQEFTTKTIKYNFDTKKGLITDVITHEGDGYIHMDTAMKYEDNTLFIRRGAYTTCDLEEPHFAIHSTIIKIIPDDKIIMGPSYLSIADIPTPLVLPFGMFPNTKGRASGVLIPTYGESKIAGFFLKDGGYYFGMNDKVDIALRADIYSKGSWSGKLYSNYKKRYGYQGNLSVRYSEFKIGEEELATSSIERDFFVTWNHNQDGKARPNSRFTAKVNAGSSSFNKFNSEISSQYLTNTFQSNVSYSRNWSRWNFSSNLRHSQNTITKTIDLNLPDIVLSRNRSSIGDLRKKAEKRRWFDSFGFSYRLDASNRIKTYDSLLFANVPFINTTAGDSIDGVTFQDFNNGIRNSLPISGSIKLGRFALLNPSATFTNRMYFQSISKTFIDTSDFAPAYVKTDTIRGFQTATDFVLNLDLRTKLYGMVQFKKLPVKAIRHVITPSVGLSYRPDYSEKKFGYYRTVQTDTSGGELTYSIFNGGINTWQGIYGSPSLGKFGSVTFRIVNNVQMKISNKRDTLNPTRKLKLIENLTFSTSYNLALDSMNWAPLSITGYTRLLSNKVYLRYSAKLDPYILVVDTNGLTNNVNRLEWTENKRLARIDDADWYMSLNVRIGPDMFSSPEKIEKKKKKKSGKGTREELEMINNNLGQYVDFKMPWHLNVSYTMSYLNDYHYTNSLIRDSISNSIIQTLGISGDINLTEKWRIGFRSGYDLENKAFTPTTIDLYRDLHCWEMSFNYVPFGFLQSYNFTIRVKSSMLQDLKLNKKRQWFDNGFN